MDKQNATRAAGRADHTSPLSHQTRAALIAELQVAVAADDWDTVIEVELAAIEHDHAHPDAPRLMDEVRAVLGGVKAVA